MGPESVTKLTIWWDGDSILLVDQTKLPRQYKLIRIKNVSELIKAIRELKIRGAPALAAAGAYGTALAASQIAAPDIVAFKDRVHGAAKSILGTRPTAINLFYGVNRVLKAIEPCIDIEEAQTTALNEAICIADEDIVTNKALGAVGASLLNDGDVVMTYCNAGRLATVGWGTALGVVRSAIDDGKRIAVYACETRPLNQGSRITAFELLEDRIPTTLIADNMAAWTMKQGKISCVIVGADRITRTAVYNKIGTYMLAICAKKHAIPFYVAAPWSTFDFESIQVEIESRNERELIFCGSKQIAPL
ncbi:MAG: S-methyl-5-thioribose-1-phosphate isomerase, partial [Euryarchaeota archaeon]|nr:S-methyl-5-thioribose-1-phosphate isomerase [Euryarchaeota archaeon]